jgi:hypothetical protein
MDDWIDDERKEGGNAKLLYEYIQLSTCAVND